MFRTPRRPAVVSFARARGASAALSLLIVLVAAGRARAEGPAESWDAVFLGGAKVGHVHTFLEPVKDGEKEYVRVRIDTDLTMKRRDDTVHITLRYGTIETHEGEVLRLDTRTRAGGQDLRVRGDVVDGQMKLIISGAGDPQSQTIAWGPDVRGPYGPEHSMARRPLKEHEERALKIYVPELNRVCDVLLKAGKIEPVVLGDRSQRPLLRVDVLTSVEGVRRPEYDARNYVDPGGQVLKTEQDVMGGIVMYRTTRAAATAPAGRSQADMVLGTVVKVGRKLPNPEATRQVRYRVTLAGSDPARAFPGDARQTVQPEAGGRSALLEVRSAGPLDGAPSSERPAPEDLQSNNLITSDDARVRALAREAVGAAADPWEKAQRITHWVFQNVRRKNLKVAFAAAADVARDRQGDCTEHSVLTAAMCRAVGVPARVATGLIYVNELEGFGYHMWNEVFVNDRWVAVDASWDQTLVDAVHLKLSASSLDGVSPFEAFLPLVTVMNKLGIEPLEQR